MLKTYKDITLHLQLYTTDHFLSVFHIKIWLNWHETCLAVLGLQDVGTVKEIIPENMILPVNQVQTVVNGQNTFITRRNKACIIEKPSWWPTSKCELKNSKMVERQRERIQNYFFCWSI